MQETRGKSFVVSILSLSLLTVMAGAAIAPALDVISAHFAGSDPFLVQMIVSMPAVFIVIGNTIFPKLTGRMGVKTLCVIGLVLYVIGGCAAGLFNNIYMVLIMRAFVGLGVGIIMPLSTGLLAFYFPPSRLNRLMGYSSAMNQMGGVIATLLAGLLSGISWRCAFLVYLMGLFSMILCAIFLPNDRLGGSKEGEDGRNESGKGSSLAGTFRAYWPNVVAMFLLMTTFFIYATNFAMVSIAEGVIPHTMISVIMAAMDFLAFFGGLSFAGLKKNFGAGTRFMAPLLFLAGYLILALIGGWIGSIAGSLLIGFANGLGIPYLMADASSKAGRNAVTTVIPMLSAALYLAQFCCPAIVSAVRGIFGSGMHLPYFLACVTAILLLTVSAFIKDRAPSSEKEKEGYRFFRLSDVMKRDVYTVSEDAPVVAALEMIVSRKISGMPVTGSGGELTGFISDGDILRHLAGVRAEFTNPYAYLNVMDSEKESDSLMNQLSQIKVGDMATRNVVTVDLSDSLADVCDVLTSHHIKKAPVMEDGRMVGVINVSNITKHVFSKFVSHKSIDNQ